MSTKPPDVSSLSDLSVSEIDDLATESRLAPKPTITTDITTLSDLADALRGLPRSQRVQVAFNWRPTDYQAQILDYPAQVDRAQVAPKKGRQVGATELAGKIGADYALHHAQTDILYTAPGQATADEMFNEFKDSFKQGPLSLTQYGVEKPNERTWKFKNGTRAMSRTLGAVGQEKNPGNRGMNPTCVIVDEAHYERDKVYEEEIEEFFITHPQYEYYLFSTPAGEQGYFYRKVEQDGIRELSQAVETEWAWFSPYWPTKISPFAQQDFIEKKQTELDSQTFAQEFLGEFASSEDSYLPMSIVKPCIVHDAWPEEYDMRWLGVDPAEKGKDRMVIYDIDDTGRCHNIWSRDTITGPEFVGLLSDLHLSDTTPEPKIGTGETPPDGYERIIVESNMGGLATDIAAQGLGEAITAVKSTRKSKGPLYKRLKRDFEAGDLEIPNYRRLVNETTKLRYKYTVNQNLIIEHPPNGHDDHPDGLMLANAGRVGLAEEFSTDIEGLKEPTPSIRDSFAV
jgi:hypothetical protein